jgi:hypothetical protein
MKTLILTAIMFVFFVCFAHAETEPECHQEEQITIRVIREFK